MKKLSLILFLFLLSACGATTIPRYTPITADLPEGAPYDIGTLQQITKSSGKVTLLHFWSSWCAVCVTELPAVASLQEQVGLSNFAVIGVSIDHDPRETKATLTRTKAALPTIMDSKQRALEKQFQILAVPQSFLFNARGDPLPLIDPQSGTRVRTLEGPQNWSSPLLIHYLRTVATDK